MDYHRENGFSNGNVVQVLSGNSGNNFANELFTNESIWATEDDYRRWNNTESSFDNNSNYDGIQSQSSEPPNKRSRNIDSTTSNRSKAIGKMFYKTKLCCKFRAGTCPYITNCNFAHSIEELRKPPPNWQEIVADNQELPREEYLIPILGVSDDNNNNNNQRSYKGRHCKKFYTEEGCPYGESCTFLHDENSRARESVAISLGPSGHGGGNGSVNGNGVMIIKPSNWKTRICNKWEITGYCPFGNKCHFAHGNAELSRFGGGQMDSEAKDSSLPDQRAPLARTSVDNAVANIPHSDGYHIGAQSQRLSNAMQKSGPRSTHKWKGPDKISKIYGDWIDDFE